MEIDLHRVNQVIVLRLKTSGAQRGKIDGVHRLVRDELDAGTQHFIIDLTSCEWIDSSGLGELVKSLATIMRYGGSMKLSGASSRLRTLLDVTNLTSILDVYPDESAALAGLTD